MTGRRGSCILFEPGKDQLHVTDTNLIRLEDLTENQLTGLTNENGLVTATLKKNGISKRMALQVRELPTPYAVSSTWKLTLEGKDFPEIEKTLEPNRMTVEIDPDLGSQTLKILLFLGFHVSSLTRYCGSVRSSVKVRMVYSDVEKH